MDAGNLVDEHRLSILNEEEREFLSDREKEVFNHVGEGRTTLEIAALLNRSVKTIETYYQHIKRKLDLENMCKLRAFAAKVKIVDNKAQGAHYQART